jgi:hypothetical protein
VGDAASAPTASAPGEAHGTGPGAVPHPTGAAPAPAAPATAPTVPRTQPTPVVIPAPEIALSGVVTCRGGMITIDEVILAQGHPDISEVRTHWFIGGTYYGPLTLAGGNGRWTAQSTFPVPDPTGSSWLVNVSVNVIDSDTNAGSAGQSFDTPCS